MAAEVMVEESRTARDPVTPGRPAQDDSYVPFDVEVHADVMAGERSAQIAERIEAAAERFQRARRAAGRAQKQREPETERDGGTEVEFVIPFTALKAIARRSFTLGLYPYEYIYETLAPKALAEVRRKLARMMNEGSKEIAVGVPANEYGSFGAEAAAMLGAGRGETEALLNRELLEAVVATPEFEEEARRASIRAAAKGR